MTTQTRRASASSGLGGTLARGILFGAVAGALWVASRKRAGPAPPLIDWDRVRVTALSIGEREYEWADLPAATASLTDAYVGWVRQSAELIGRYVGSELPVREDSVFVFGRREWIAANQSAFKLLFAPIERISAEILHDGTVGSHWMGGLNQLVISSEMGVLIGYLSRRVLGQYDLALLGREPLANGDGGRLYFVEPNIAQVQERLDLDPDEFRLWIALHETTHAFEFERHPWVRLYMNDLLGEYFQSLSKDLFGLRKHSSGSVDFVQRIGGNLFRGGNALEAVMNSEQRGIFNRLQALMCLLEGYSNHVMDEVGSSLLASYPTMKARFEDRRRNKSFGERLFAKLTGLDVKLEQYVLGERFVGEVVRQRDISYMNRAWDGPAALPTLDEIRDPAAWIARIGA